MMLEALPLTPNGKVDRRALSGLSQMPERTGFEPADALIAPRDILELRLVHIWEELLGVQPIGIRHDFFELGGHSLLAVRLMAHIKQELGVRLPLVRLFEGATVERLADVLRNSPEVAPASSLVKLQAGQSNKRPLFFVHPAGGNVLCYAHLVRYLDRDQPCYGLQAPGLNGEQELYTQLEAIARHHIDLLRIVQPTGPYLLSGWSLGGVVAFEAVNGTFRRLPLPRFWGVDSQSDSQSIDPLFGLND